jgi:curli biogenesis system outer membrane secretion channel CsgG
MKKLLILGSALLLAQTIFTGSAVAAGKPVVAVAEFHNTARSAYWWNSSVGWDLSDMLTNELADTGKFRVVERAKLQHVLREQDLGASGRVARGTAARVGKLTGARYLIMGSVAAFQHNTSGSSGGVSFGGIHVGGSKEKAYIAVDLRVVDSTTGEIMYSRTVEAHAQGKSSNVGLSHGGLNLNQRRHNKTPTGKVVRAVIMEAADYLTCAMVDKGGCMKEFNRKERRRRNKAKKSIQLD